MSWRRDYWGPGEHYCEQEDGPTPDCLIGGSNAPGYSTTAVPDCPYQCGGIGGHAYGCPEVSIEDPWFDGYQEANRDSAL